MAFSRLHCTNVYILCGRIIKICNFAPAFKNQLDEADRGGWIYTAVRNTCLNRMKHLQVERDNAKALYEATLADVKSNYREHEALLQKAKTIARSLPEPTCTILRLCYYEHLTYREVAQQLGISPDTVKKHISKALRTLREAMKE